MFKSAADKHACVNALRVAAEKFDINAGVLTKDCNPPLTAMADIFRRQAKDARRIAKEIEEWEDR